MKQTLTKPPVRLTMESCLHANSRSSIVRWVMTLSACCALAASLQAATIPVTNTADEGPDAPAPGSLRAALAAATDGDTVDATGVSGTITLMPGSISSAQLVVSANVIILGPGPANLTVDANHLSRVFHITPGHAVSIDGLAIANGVASGSFPANSGGGIYNDHSALTVSNCVISGNSADGEGGGIFNDGGVSGSATLTVIASTLSGNSAASEGGGIYNNSNGGGSATLTVIASTVSNSAAEEGGGIVNDGNVGGSARLTVIASTLSGNSADARIGPGGAIENNTFNPGDIAVVSIANSTLSGNSAFQGGGIYSEGPGFSEVLVVNSTFSGNSASFRGSGIYNEVGTLEIGSTILTSGAGDNIVNTLGLVHSRGFNLISDSGVHIDVVGGTGDLDANGDQLNTDPLLGPLADNGGPTLTHLPMPGSPAIDRGSSDGLVAFGLTTDQRGLPRTVDDPNLANAFLGDGTDIGAVEVAAPNHSPVAKCKDVTVLAGLDGTANASIDDGSFDPDNDAINIVQDPLGPYPIGPTRVTLTVTDSHGGSSSCTATVTVVAVADLAISKAVVSGQAKPGQVLIYTIIVTNAGPNTASGLVVNDAVPQGTTFASASPAPSTAPAVGAGGAVVWNVGSLASGASRTLTLTVKVSVKGNTLIVNTATVTSSSSDPNLANNTATVTSKRITK